ncbi:MAG TPA: hypothetical protein VGL86_29005 [Polyangia bacterium]|jgi:hypothetical protein
MIPYEELVAALDRYVARNGGTPQSAHAPASSAMPAFAPPPPVEHYDEHHDPDLHGGLAGHGGHEDGGEDATHVGAATAPAASHEDHSNEIDIGDVLTDDEL